MDYIEMSIEQGYSREDHSDKVLESVGMAIERALCDWGWYAAGESESKHYYNVVDHFSCSEEEPNEKALVDAYAEGMVC